MFRRDRNCFGGGLCLYGNDSTGSTQLNSHEENIDAEAICLNKIYEKENKSHRRIKTSKPKRFSIFGKPVE